MQRFPFVGVRDRGQGRLDVLEVAGTFVDEHKQVHGNGPGKNLLGHLLGEFQDGGQGIFFHELGQGAEIGHAPLVHNLALAFGEFLEEKDRRKGVHAVRRPGGGIGDRAKLVVGLGLGLGLRFGLRLGLGVKVRVRVRVKG